MNQPTIYYYFAKSYLRSLIARIAFRIAPTSLSLKILEWALNSVIRDNEIAKESRDE